MPIPVLSNRYAFPPGYRHAVFANTYIPWNGGMSSINSPGVSVTGHSLDITTDNVPSDLSTLQIFAGGVLYIFQFVYNLSAPSIGIPVLLPASGGSTDAQVSDALFDVLQAASGTTFDGDIIPFPWSAQEVSPILNRINFNFAGLVETTVTPEGITTEVTGFGELQLSAYKCPARVGRLGALLPG